MPRAKRSEIGVFEGNMKYAFPADVRRFLLDYHAAVGVNQTPQQTLYEIIRSAAAIVHQEGINHHVRRQVFNKTRSMVTSSLLKAFQMIEADLVNITYEESDPDVTGIDDLNDGTQTEFLEPGDGNDGL